MLLICYFSTNWKKLVFCFTTQNLFLRSKEINRMRGHSVKVKKINKGTKYSVRNVFRFKFSS